jgi:hypothetical protein
MEYWKKALDLDDAKEETRKKIERGSI